VIVPLVTAQKPRVYVPSATDTAAGPVGPVGQVGPVGPCASGV